MKRRAAALLLCLLLVFRLSLPPARAAERVSSSISPIRSR